MRIRSVPIFLTVLVAGAGYGLGQGSSVPASNQGTVPIGVTEAAIPSGVIGSVPAVSTTPGKPNVVLGAKRTPGNMTYHGGNNNTHAVQHNQRIYTVFWEPPGTTGLTFEYQDTINRFIRDLSGSAHYAIASQYGDAAGPISPFLTLVDTWRDESNPIPSLDQKSIQDEVHRAATANKWTLDENTLVYVFSPIEANIAVDPGDCAWHAFEVSPSKFTYGLTRYPKDYSATGKCFKYDGPFPNGKIIDAAIDATVHEIIEAATDPFFTGWYYIDKKGEIGDQCAGELGPRFTTVDDRTVSGDVYAGGHLYLVQMEWSNASSKCVIDYSFIPPSITKQPQSQAISSFQKALLTVEATGTPTAGQTALSYQWYEGVSGNLLASVPVSTAGANSNTFLTPPLTQTTSYWVTVSSNYGIAISSTALVTVTNPPPLITTQPVGRFIFGGQTATLTVAATGATPLNYQWFEGTTGVTATPVGINSSSYTTPALTQDTSYWVKVSNTVGFENSYTAAIRISANPPSIVSQPASRWIKSGSTAPLRVDVSGNVPLTYQWYQGNRGDTSRPVGSISPGGLLYSTHTPPALTATTSYWVKITNAAGSVDSATATITVFATDIAPTITTQPASRTISSGRTATLSVTATGTELLRLQWYQGSSGDTTIPVGDPDSTSYTTPQLSRSMNYWVQVRNVIGSVDSATATVAVDPRAPNDQLSNATVIPLSPYSNSVTTFGVGLDLSDPIPTCGRNSNGSVWWAYTATADGRISATTSGSSYDTILSAYTGPPGRFTEVACNDNDAPTTQSKIGFPSIKGITYYFLVSSDSNTAGTLQFQLYAQSAITGDNFFESIPILSLPHTTPTGGVVSTAATPESTDPVPSCNRLVSKSVWFSYYAYADGTLTADTLGSNYDTLLSVYTGKPGSFSEVACNRDSTPGVAQSRVSFAAVADTLYYFMAGDEQSSLGNLNLTFHLSYVAPSNDPISGAVVVSSLPFTNPTGGVGTAGASTESTDPLPSCAASNRKSVWYRYTPAAGGTITADTYGSRFSAILSVYTGAPGSLSAVLGACDAGTIAEQPRISFTAFAGTTYYFMVSSLDNTGGNLTIHISAVLAPANDNIANAAVISAGPYTNTVTTILATTESTDPLPSCSSNSSKSVWYRYTPSGGGKITVDTSGSDYDTVLSAYAGAPGSLSPVAGSCNDDFLVESGASRISFAAVAGTTYYFMVSSYPDGGVLTIHLTVESASRAPSDFDGDLKSDLAVFRPSNGSWWVLKSGAAFTTYLTTQWGQAGDTSLSGDFDGDGKADIANYRPSSGTWWILTSSTGFTNFLSYQWGLSGDVPVIGDFDGDGKTDITVYRPSNGTWWVLQSSSGFTTYLGTQWGLSGDVPISGDFDGDGKADIAVYRPSNGTWYALKSSTGFTTFSATGWGQSGDIPISGDFDGDGKTDITVYRPSNGTWWVLTSSTNFTSYVNYQWGANGDTPLIGDFDGDGKTDIAIYRPSDSTWWILKSSANFLGYSSYQWGISGDVPALRP